jgi:carbamoylphosphate synthase small subunit
MQQKLTPALLALEDGTLWPGSGFGAMGQTSGEIVFNTSLTGYQGNPHRPPPTTASSSP